MARKFREDIVLHQNSSLEISIQWDDELIISGYEESHWLSKEEAVALASAILVHYSEETN